MKWIKNTRLKRAMVLTIMISFIVSTLGVNMAIGYCPMKKSYSFSFFKQSIPCCCSKPHKGNCCKSNQLVFKKITDHYYPSVFKIINYQPINISKSYELVLLEPPVYYHICSKLQYKPPISRPPLTILYRSILI